MDNSNNNSTNNPFPPLGDQPTSLGDQPTSYPQAGTNPPPQNPTPLGDQPTSYPNATWPPASPPPPSTAAWDPNTPSPATPTGQGGFDAQNTPFPNQPATPTPTYTPPTPPPPVDTTPLGTYPQTPPPQDNPWNPPSQSATPTTSPLDNPWGAPAQPPPIDGPTQPSTPAPEPSSPPPWSPQPSQPAEVPPTMSLGDQPTSLGDQPTTEPAPTDLSHLINNSGSPALSETTQPANGGAETLVAPANGGTPDVPTLPTEGHKGFPKWAIGVGIGLLIIVMGASAYFILGIGQNPQTTSIPAETTQSTQVRPPAPIPTPVAQPVATGSANFGELQGSGTQQATSAADLIRQRQQQQQGQ